jgi:aminopeptidase N
VSVTPNAQALTFAGKVSIAVDVLQPTTSITLNALDLTFQSVRLNGPNVSYSKPTVRIDDKEQTATFTFDKSLAAGGYRLDIEYQGKIGTQANGLFAIDYDTAAGRKRALYTQFENSDARRFIPSWDEPAYKATFTLDATVPSNQMAVSNLPITRTTPLAEGRSLIRFAQSPKMSTYLLFFGLGEFDRTTARVGPTEVGVVTQKGLASQAAFVLESAQAVLREYNDYFAIPYPLPKLDNVASPGSSRFFGAMENWGAIYTFEHTLLLNPSISTQSDKQYVFSVAAHEMAHQWFGDLVTMSWWDDLWLNEGFATWMADRTTILLHPEWNTALEAVQQRERAMSLDSLAATHPVVQHVETVEQASQAFDDITYEKGAAVIRMLEGYVGADAWRTGVRQYIKAHTYGNTVSDDLWREIETAAKQPILAIAHDFTLLPGVPMIRVGESICADGKTTLQITQSEFSRDQPAKKSLKWRVPVIVQAPGGDAVRTLLTGKATVTVPGCGATIVNAGQSGYFRTLYSPQHFAKIKQAFASVAPIDQLGILNDTWSLGLNGQQAASDILDLAAALPADADPQTWGHIASVFDALNDYYVDTGARQEAFRAFAIARLAPILARIGWNAQPKEPDTIAILRNRLIATLSALGDDAVIAEARRRYAASKSDPVAMPAPLRKTILGVVARHADPTTWDQLHAAAQKEKTSLVKDNLYSLLSSSSSASLARRALDLSLTAEPGATNSAEMIARVAELHPDLAFDFALAHMNAVNEKVDVTSRSSYYPALATLSIDPAMIKKVKAYADANVVASSRRTAETAMARITYRIKVRNERLPAIDVWLARSSG